jgi:BirA family biotin operon repressor/biotin-[acetyl-CoA-carboxylase] ligase
VDALKRLLKELHELYNTYLKDGSAGILAEAGALSSIEGLDITVFSQEGTFEARAVGMDDYGALIVKDEAGALRRLLSAEVSVRRS